MKNYFIEKSDIKFYLFELLLEGPVLLVGGGVAIAGIRCRWLRRRGTATEWIGVLLEPVERCRVLLDVETLLSLGCDCLHGALNETVTQSPESAPERPQKEEHHI